MKYHLILLLCILGLSNTSFAQFDYDVSKPYPVVDGEKFYTAREGEMVAVKRHRKEIHIQRFDSKKLSLTNTKVYDETELPRGFVLEKLLQFEGKCFLFFNVWDKPNATEQLFSREIDMEKGEFVGKNKLLFKIDGKITGTPLFKFSRKYSSFSGRTVPLLSINMNGSKKFGFAFSQDSSKLLVQYRRKPVEKRDAKNHDLIGMYVYSSGLEKITGKEMEMPYSEKKMDNLDYTVDAEGNPYLIAKVFPDNSNREKTKNPDGKGKVANYKIELIKVDIDRGSYRITPIEIGDKFITKISLFESTDNKMSCIGYYNSLGPTKASSTPVFSSTTSARQTNPPVDGACVFKVDKDGGVYDLAHYEIPVEVMNMYERKGKQKSNERKDARGKAQFENLMLKECLVQDDGSIILVGEQYHVKDNGTTTVSVTGQAQSRPEYLYEDMLITKIGADGKLAWMQKLPKRQSSSRSEKGGMSFKYIHDEANGNHYLMYLDNVHNIDLDINKIPKKHVDGKGGFLTSYKINDETGKVSKENLFDLRDVKGINVFQFNTDRVVHTSGSEFLVEIYKKGKEDILVRLNVR